MSHAITFSCFDTGKNLILMLVGLNLFLRRAKQLDQATVDGVKLFTTILSEVGSGLIKTKIDNMLAAFVGKENFKSLFEVLNDDIADGFVTFANKMAGTDLKNAEKASKDAEDKIRKLTEENELLKKASDFSGMDEKTLTEVFKKVAPALEKFGYKVSLTKEAVSN